MKLISMTEYTLELMAKYNSIVYQDDLLALQALKFSLEKYANFLKKPLTLDMFDKENGIFKYNPMFSEWGLSDLENSTIEDLLTDDIDYFLNSSAKQQLGL